LSDRDRPRPGPNAAGADAPPVLHDVGVIALVPDTFGGPWQAREHLLTRLARYCPVVWSNPPTRWRDALRTDPTAHNVRGEIASTPNFVVYEPGRFAPEVFRPRAAGMLLARLRLARARRLLVARGCKKIVLYLWRPEFAYALDLVEHDLSVYHIDDEYTFSPVEQPMDAAELALIRAVDLVFIHSAAMLAKKGHLNPDTRLIPNGVDFAAYSTPVPEAPDLASIPHPRIGYIGRIKDQIDIPLLASLAASHPDYSFVFVGKRVSLSRTAALTLLESLPNVHFLGVRRVEELPAYAQHLDVMLLCYVLTDYTKYIYPIKLHEYLATGHPAIATPIPAVRDFADVVTIAEGTEAWSHALAAALAPDENTPERTAARQAVAEQFDWMRLAGDVAHAFAERLGPDYAGRLSALPAKAPRA
jgi:glycosyltransferase involved in cell wall biosynthesis